MHLGIVLLLGSAVLFIQTQVLGLRIEMIEAAVLENNDVDQEQLLSLSLLIQLDILPPDFLNRSITDYFNKLLSNKQITTTYSSLYTKQTEAFDEQEKKIQFPRT